MFNTKLLFSSSFFVLLRNKQLYSHVEIIHASKVIYKLNSFLYI